MRDHSWLLPNIKQMLFSGQSLARGWRNTKKVIGDAWHHTTKLASQFDSGMQVGRRLLASVSPILDQLNVNMKPIMSGLTAYDRGKTDVMTGYNNVQNHYNRIRRQVPELGM